MTDRDASAAASGDQPPAGRVLRAGVLVGLLVGLLGFAVVVQVRTSASQSALTSARQEDLVRILDDLSAREDRLRADINQLQASRDRLVAGSGPQATAMQEARQRANQLGVLAGTLPARGPGVVVTITQEGGHLPAADLLDALEELRGAGAEAIEVEGRGGVVRVGAATWFTDHGAGVLVEGVQLAPPYRFEAIGDPPTLAAALNIPGGVVDLVAKSGGRATIAARPAVAVDALRRLDTPQYARPAR